MQRSVLVVAFLVISATLVFSAGTEPPGIANLTRDAIRQPSTYINARVLAANVAEIVTAPTSAAYPSAAMIGVFSPTCSNWYYSAIGTAAVPAGDVTDGSAAGRAPVALRMAQGATVSIVADATCTVTTEWYVVRQP